MGCHRLAQPRLYAKKFSSPMLDNMTAHLEEERKHVRTQIPKRYR